MSSNHVLSGVYAAAVTPLKPDGTLDSEALPKYLGFLAKRGCHGVLLLGTTGEGPSFSAAERLDLLRAAMRARQQHPGLRILAGTGTPSLEETASLTRAAFDLGVDGVVVLPPYYFKKVSDDGLFDWYRQVIVRAVPAGGYLLAYHIRPDFEPPRVMTRLAQRVSDRVKVRPARRKHLKEDAAIMLDVFNDAWAHNWGFVPLVAAEWEETVLTLARLMPDDYIQIAEYDGEPVAFIVALPNLNEAIRDLKGKLLPFGWAKLLWRLKVRHPRTARIPLMGVRQSFQHSRLGPTLAFMVIDAVRRAMHARGVKNVEMGWILEDNDGMRNIIETIGGQAYKRYRVYEKDL